MEDRTQQVGDGGGNEVTRQMLPGSATVGVTQMSGDPMRTVQGVATRALEMECIPGNRYGLAGERSNLHLLMLIKSVNLALGRRMPLNVCLVIDRSGSMEGEPLDYVKRACGYVVDLMEPTDVLSIVTFEEQVDVVMPARRVVNKTLIKEHIQRIQPGNTTNLYDGLVTGCAQVASVHAEGMVNRVLLLTDGEPTSGIRDFASIVNQVAEQKSRGITITALGFGSEYNEELVAGIARRSGGNYYYIQRPDLIPEVFRRELETLMTITAKNPRITLQLAKWIQLRQVYGTMPAIQGRNIEVGLPDIERGSIISTLVELEVDRHPAAAFRIARAQLTYDDAVSNRTERIEADAILDFTSDRSRIADGENAVVQRELEVALASRNLEKTLMGMRTQQIASPTVLSEMQRTRTVLLNQGKTQEAADLQAAMDSIRQGGEIEKTLIGTIYNLDRGKSS